MFFSWSASTVFQTSFSLSRQILPRQIWAEFWFCISLHLVLNLARSWLQGLINLSDRAKGLPGDHWRNSWFTAIGESSKLDHCLKLYTCQARIIWPHRRLNGQKPKAGLERSKWHSALNIPLSLNWYKGTLVLLAWMQPSTVDAGISNPVNDFARIVTLAISLHIGNCCLLKTSKPKTRLRHIQGVAP